jgi:hypothetical protein
MSTLVDNLQVTQAIYTTDYRIEFTFSDGTVHEVDFYPFLSRPHQNPMVTQYLDKDRFRQFEIIKHQDISWDDYEMCFPLETLYTGKF